MQTFEDDAASPVLHVAVVAITYRRPHGLAKLLRALEGQVAPERGPFFRLSAVVVDNDRAASAAAVVKRFEHSLTLPIRYVVEFEQGIPLARNTGIASLPEDADFLCFIDDDEWPGTTWIAELLKTQRATGAECVHGAVIPVYPDGAPRWLRKSRIFESWDFPDQAMLREAASNNVMISTAFMRRTGHRFDERMRMTGGSDYLFFQQAVALGMRIVWSAAAPVYEEVPASRMTLRWVAQRQYRLGNTFSLSERLAGTRTGLVKWVLKGLARMGLGAVMLPLLLFSPYYGMRAIRHLLRGAGTVAGAFGHIHEEYSPKGLARDRGIEANRRAA
ncbi:MAG TPA: glycosyltransferase [Burkholderiales bacterium]|nr:glycosyltransferase [Burkholderiales bacterium]